MPHPTKGNRTPIIGVLPRRVIQTVAYSTTLVGLFGRHPDTNDLNAAVRFALYPSTGPRLRTQTFLIQSQACYQLHQSSMLVLLLAQLLHR